MVMDMSSLGNTCPTYASKFDGDNVSDKVNKPSMDAPKANH